MATELADSVRVGRQAIYDWDRSVVAYEMLFRPAEATLGLYSETEHEQATSQVISAVFGDFGVTDLVGDLPLFLNVTRSFLTGELPLPEAGDQLVVEVVPHVGVEPDVLAGVRRLRESGIRVAVDGWTGDPRRLAVVELADIVKIDLGALPIADLPDVIADTRRVNPQATIAVERVEDAETMRVAHEFGATLFQGFHLQRPQVLETPRLAPSEVMCLRLLGLLAEEDVSPVEVESVVASDPGLAVRVLRTASSAAAAGRPLTSLRQALTLIGPRTLSSWVVLMLVGGTGSVPRETVVQLLARAGACANLCPTSPHVAYTVGLLSAVSEMLGMSAYDTIRSTGVGTDVADALAEGTGEVGLALRAVLAHERDNPSAVLANGFTPLEVSRACLDAVRTANATAGGVG